jgi:alkylation response protein AidB-like acyl-CoA dehydrogenase
MTITSRQSEGLLFQLKHIARLESLQESEIFAHADLETVSMILEQAAGFAEEHLAPLAVLGDVEGCKLDDGRVLLPAGTHAVWQSWCELGFPALSLPAGFEGLGFPRVVQSAVQEICDGANLSFGMLAINLRCAALALIKSANSEFIERYVPGLVSGAIASTIAISEPQAGSDVGRILTSAEVCADGSWLLSGSKIWISYADHDATADIVHLVLARVPNGEAGTRGLGLFLVPGEKNSVGRQDNGISILRLEHKMGLHSSPTCVLEFKQSRGWLIGAAGKGLQALFAMMNPMRLAVAVQGAAVAAVATLHAVRYAQERPQGGNPLSPPLMIADHADVRRMLLEMTAQSELMRALALRTACLLDQAESSAGDLAQTALSLGELLLPVAKTRNAESAFHVANLGIQVLGGYGYTNDYPLERMARDIRVAAIYEGTSGIQSLDFLKRKVMADKGQTIYSLLDLVRQETANANSPYSSQLPALCGQLEATVQFLLAEASTQTEAGAYALLQLAGLVADGWNGHTLYCAATGDSDHEQRLKAALEYHAGSLLEQAALWAVRARQSLPAYRFR